MEAMFWLLSRSIDTQDPEGGVEQGQSTHIRSAVVKPSEEMEEIWQSGFVYEEIRLRCRLGPLGANR